MKDINYLSITKVAVYLGVSDDTIKRWYRWFENDNYPKSPGLDLPKYIYLDKRKTKYFHKDDLPKLEEFRDKIQNEYRGEMAEFNANFYWNKSQRRNKLGE